MCLVLKPVLKDGLAYKITIDIAYKEFLFGSSVNSSYIFYV